MKRIVLEAKNNYDELFESIKGLCFPTIPLPTYEEKLPRYADFSSKCPHPVFAKDVQGKYFIVTEERSTVHKYSFIYNNDTLELTENGQKPPMSDAIGRSTKYVCSYLPGYENTKATIITHSGYGIVIKIEGKKDVTVRGTYLINQNDELIVYAEDGKRYIFENKHRRVSPTADYLSLSASSPDNMMGDYHIPYFTVFNIMHFDPYESISEGVYKFTDSNGNDNLISIYGDGSALAEAYYNGEKHVLNGFYTQTGKSLALSVIIDHEIHTAYFNIQNNSFSKRMYGEGDPPTSIFEVLSQPGIEYTKTKAKLKQNPQKSKKYFCPTDDPTVLHTVEIFESGTVLLYASKRNRYYASGGHLTEINNELHVTSKFPISYLIFRKNDDGSLTLTFADISDGQNVSYIPGSTFQRYD